LKEWRIVNNHDSIRRESSVSPSARADGDWDLVLRPQSRWFDLDLAGLWRYRDLIGLFVRRDFVALYKQTVLGPVWFILQPLLTTIVFTIVFGMIARLPTQGLPMMLFYMSGNTLWLYFASCLTHTSGTFITNASMFGKVYFPRLAVPVAVVISQALKLGLQLLFFAGFWVFYWVTGSNIELTWAAWLLPVEIAIMAGLGLGCGMIISACTSKYRDLQFLVQFGVQLLMYGTTVIFPLTSIQGHLSRLFVLANPMTAVIEAFRFGFLGSGTLSLMHLGYSAAFAVVTCLLGAALFSRVERTFMDTV
jgi:lipopolysaccharide transport system permease protein